MLEGLCCVNGANHPHQPHSDPNTQLWVPAAAQHTQMWMHVGNPAGFQQNPFGKSIMLKHLHRCKRGFPRREVFCAACPQSFRCMKSFRSVAGCKELQRPHPRGQPLVQDQERSNITTILRAWRFLLPNAAKMRTGVKLNSSSTLWEEGKEGMWIFISF